MERLIRRWRRPRSANRRLVFIPDRPRTIDRVIDFFGDRHLAPALVISRLSTVPGARVSRG